ncbi:LytTR family DNA-binding domain-containing protein [Chryseobacterium sp. MYb264]|uniref:LytR/AlgR family response regulator transcription factor n=1 Tax=Chryseobacterium sp. MYb264 TaxID=2745153 RepID=UPI002E11D9E0|nr:LytTR family DNA-binding domain-containing protein [Chryseobacterium sp. MYb264]
MYKAIIIDDEEMARMLLKGMVKEFCPDVDIADLCCDLPNGIKSIRKHKPDIVFLDIEMPGHSGLELLDFFDENEIDFSIIFVTAYHQYAIQAFKLSAVDYLLKPIDDRDLVNAVSSFKKRKNSRTDYSLLKENLNSPTKKIALSVANSVLFVPLEDILFFKADGSYTHVILRNGETILTSRNLKYYEETLFSDNSFYRCHKSFIVNISHITEYVKSDGGYLKVGEHCVNVSSDKVSLIFDKLKI